MKKIIIFLLTVVIYFSSSVKSMEQGVKASEVKQSESLWEELPFELQQIILSYVSLDKVTSFAQLLDKLKKLEKNQLFSKFVNDKAFIASLAKIYIEKRKDQAYKEFFDAVIKNEVSLVGVFIDGGIDVNHRIDGTTFLMASINYNARNYNNYYYLYNGVSNNCMPNFKYEETIEIVRMLIEAGADVNTCEDDGSAALILALDASNWPIAEETAKILIEVGSSINIKDNWGNTPLILAAANGYKEIVKILIKAGADVNARDNDGRSALTEANDRVNLEMIKILKEAGAL